MYTIWLLWKQCMVNVYVSAHRLFAAVIYVYIFHCCMPCSVFYEVLLCLFANCGIFSLLFVLLLLNAICHVCLQFLSVNATLYLYMIFKLNVLSQSINIHACVGFALLQRKLFYHLRQGLQMKNSLSSNSFLFLTTFYLFPLSFL